jgi:hypothetical protein
MSVQQDPTESVDVTVTKDGTALSPVYTEEVTVDAIGSSSRVTDACGNTENRDTDTTGWQITLDTYLTDEQWRKLRQMDLRGANANIRTDPIVDTFVIEEIKLTQTEAVNKWKGPDGEYEGQLLYNVSITTKDESNEGF